MKPKPGHTAKASLTVGQVRSGATQGLRVTVVTHRHTHTHTAEVELFLFLELATVLCRTSPKMKADGNHGCT